MKNDQLSFICISIFCVLCFTLGAKAQQVNSKTITGMIKAAPEQVNSFTGFAFYDLDEKKNDC